MTLLAASGISKQVWFCVPQPSTIRLDHFTAISEVWRIVSSYLFAVFHNEISVYLGLTRTVCIVGNMFGNHLLFAGDTRMLGFSINDLQDFLDICYDCAAEHLKVLNCNKTFGKFPP